MLDKDKYKDETIATHAGRYPDENDGVINPPVYHASTILFSSYEDFKNSGKGKSQGRAPKAHYGRHGSESNRNLEEALATLEGADKCLLASSGVSAITTSLLAFLEPGDELLMVDSAYSPTREFCDEELKRYNITTRYYNPQDSDLEIRDNTKVIFVESPGSLTFELQDIPAIAKKAHEKNAVIVMDNTWGTPLFFKAFEHGVDVSIHSATKYISGHSDFLMGVINCTDEVYPKIKRVYKNLGICPGPDDVYLAQRGLRTMPVRMEAQGRVGVEIAKWLESHEKISRVLHPALESHPQHRLWKRDFLGTAGLFSIILKKHLSEKELSKFFNEMKLFGLGYSWGGYESLALPFNAKNIRTATSWEAEGTAIRLSIGLENQDDLKKELDAALNRI